MEEKSATQQPSTVTSAVSEIEDDNKDENPHGVTPVTSAFADWKRGPLVRKFWRLYLTGVMVCVGGMYIGYGNSVVGSIIANRGFVQQFATVTNPDTGEPDLDAHHLGLWNGLNFVAQIVVQMISPFTADRWGRKFNMWAFTFFLTLSIIFEIVAQEWIMILWSRILGGFAGGLLATSIMTYMSEISLPQFRGALLGSFSLFFALGQVFLAIGLKVLEDTDPFNFRNVFYSEFVFFGLWLVPLVYLPESPAWYAAQDRDEDAKRSLRRLVGPVDGYDLDHEYAVVKFEVAQSARLARARGSDWRALASPVNLKRIVIATLPFTFQNFVGVPLIFGYTTYFLQLANVADPFLGNLMIQLILVVGIVSAFYFIDIVGRRSLVIWSGAAMGAICLVIGGLGFMGPNTTSSGIGLVTLCCVWAFVYANSLAPIGWISLVEVSSPLLRAKTAAVAAIIQSLSGVLFNYTVPLMLSNQGANWGQRIGLFFGGITFAYLVPVLFLFPETKGRTYQELDELFERRIPAWRFHETKTAHQTGVEMRLGGH
ncbi:general substrate transporter [Sodiomyces alkalinus F11]|uniref:General substrate transporter n=1 Tax=Sodiomyces alkalinus (strain CBS 110278 / VKM F-3762 / F11) TaxID=1314773 RepID=A0A3N2PTZ5_SODAK|nr:general substrate transporter [Sodiomyces alkalinus F11]ROT37977.1 general substrate transporter [Sodiomyces alkalinus F11]